MKPTDNEIKLLRIIAELAGLSFDPSFALHPLARALHQRLNSGAGVVPADCCKVCSYYQEDHRKCQKHKIRHDAWNVCGYFVRLGIVEEASG